MKTIFSQIWLTIFLLGCCMALTLNSSAQKGLTLRVGYTNPILGGTGKVYGGSAGIELEYDLTLSETGSQFYVGLGFTFFTPKPGPWYGYDGFGDYAQFTFGKMPVIPLIVGIRQGLFNKKLKPMVGLDLGYYFCYYNQKSNSASANIDYTIAGGMVGLAPCIGLMLNYDKRISYGADFRTHFMADVKGGFYFFYLDAGVFVNYAF